MRTKTLPFAFLLLAACQTALPQPPTAPTSEAPGPGQPLAVQRAPGPRCAPLGSSRPADDGCNTCTCGEDGWACTAMGCVGPNTIVDPGADDPPADDPPADDPPADDPRSTAPKTCTPGQTVLVPNQRQVMPLMCDAMPPECGAGMHLGSEGGCHLCVPDVAPPDRDSSCVCNDDGRWVCTER